MIEHAYDIVVLGATPAGITAAIAAAREGRRVLLLERTAHIGGLPANGLGVTDIATRESAGGLFKDFISRIRNHYLTTFGPDSPQAKDNSDGYAFEPHIAEQIFEAMLKEQPNVTVLRRRQFDSSSANVTMQGNRLVAMQVTNRDSRETESFRGTIFIDATYEGDLAAAAGAPFRVGRESQRDHGEPFAGRVYWSWFSRRLLPGSTFEGDEAVQAYNYRYCLTKNPARRVPIEKPDDYRRDEYRCIVDDLTAGKLRHAVYRYPRAATAKPVPIPNGKFDVNDHPKSLISSDLPEENWSYPTSNWGKRDQFAKRLRDYELGMLWFCQNDPALPQAFREDALQWGLPADEFADNGHFPRQLYVREARRIMGEYLFTALDCIAPQDVDRAAQIVAGEIPAHTAGRAKEHQDAIAAAHYPIDSHACRKREPGRDALDGYFALNEITRPYTIPFGVIVPQKVDSLLVPVACSATHLGFGTLRMEPCWMALGEAAGVAAHTAIEDHAEVRRASITRIRSLLRDRGAVLEHGVTP